MMLSPVVVRLPRSATPYAAIVILAVSIDSVQWIFEGDWPRGRIEYKVAIDVDRAVLAVCAQVLNLDGPADERAARLQLTGSEHHSVFVDDALPGSDDRISDVLFSICSAGRAAEIGEADAGRGTVCPQCQQS